MRSESLSLFVRSDSAQSVAAPTRRILSCVHENEIWVVQHARHDPPSYQRLYGPFQTGDDAARWAAQSDLPDFHIALRVLPPGDLGRSLTELREAGQLTADGRSLDGVSANEFDAAAERYDEPGRSGGS